MRAVWMVVGGLVGAFCVLCVAIGIGDVFDGNNDDLGTTIATTWFFTLGVVGGSALFWTNFRREQDGRPSRQGRLDQHLLTIAAGGDGC
jgi:hypothetical protein